MKKNFFVVAAVIFSSQLNAQWQDTTTLDEVIVTANKFEQKQSQTGKVITVITKAQLQKNAGKTLGQVLNEQAGITLAGAYNATGSVQTVFMRGASSGRTLILIDGIPVGDPSMIYNESDLNFFSINDIERIEICKGSQSTLYGSDAIAGVINIITINKNISKPFTISTTAIVGNKNTFLNNSNVYGKVNQLEYSVRFTKTITDGFSSAYDTTGGNNYDDDGYNGTGVNAMVQYQLNPGLSMRGFIRHSNYKADIDASAFNDDKDFTLDHSNLISGFGIGFKKGIANINGNYQYSNISRKFTNDSLHAPGFILFEKNNYDGISHFAELYGSILASKRLTVLAGFDFRHNSMEQEYFSISSFGPYSANFPDTSMNQASVYASLFFRSADKRLNLEFGGRMNKHSSYGYNATYTFNPSFSATKNLRIFGSIATGFKSPSLYQLFDAFSGNPELEAEKAINYEVGVQHLHEKISSRLIYFHRNIENGIDYNYISNRYFNFIKQKVNGIEMEVSSNPFNKLNITANYTFLSGREETQSRKNFNDTAYSYLLRRPKHDINISVNYQVASSFNVGVSGKSVSNRYDVGGFMQDDVLLKSYFLLNARAAYKLNEHIKFFADAQNITNKKFFDIQGYNAIPFIINGGITLQW